MSVKYLLVFLLSCIFKNAIAEIDETPTSTRVYNLDVPGASPIRIVEGENFWEGGEETTPKTISRFEHRLLKKTTALKNLRSRLNEEQEDNSAEFSHSALRDFLNNYAEKVVKDKQPTPATSDEDKEGKKSWSLMNLREHNHPYEDKKGWVSLEPVPWSLSKISKWQSKSTTTQRPWDSFPSYENKPNQNFDYSLDRVSSWNRPHMDNGYNYNIHPDSSENKYNMYYVDDEKPSYSKPAAVYGQTVHLQSSSAIHRNPSKTNNNYKNDHNCNNEEDVGIITDGRPANFPTPSYYENRRIGTELHPTMGEGEWILLSTTKGYKLPKKQRSLDMNPQSIGTHQSVRLTVLPPLKTSKVNMTTSHGGLLQVDSTFETVEQAQKKFIKLQKLKDKPKASNKPMSHKPLKKRKPLREITGSTIATIPRNTQPDSGAVLAAVGAGMIPATMAMLVPVALNGGRRRKRSILFATSNPSPNLQITLPRYI